jgi:uncharacterized protein (TIGR02118 family)
VIKLVALLKRKPGISREEFAHRWVVEHTRISSELPGLTGYRINIASERQPSGAGVEPIYDGTAEMWWESVDAMEAAFETEVGRLAGADADGFADVRIHVYTEEHVVIAGPDR